MILCASKKLGRFLKPTTATRNTPTGWYLSVLEDLLMFPSSTQCLRNWPDFRSIKDFVNRTNMTNIGQHKAYSASILRVV